MLHACHSWAWMAVEAGRAGPRGSRGGQARAWCHHQAFIPNERARCHVDSRTCRSPVSGPPGVHRESAPHRRVRPQTSRRAGRDLPICTCGHHWLRFRPFQRVAPYRAERGSSRSGAFSPPNLVPRPSTPAYGNLMVARARPIRDDTASDYSLEPLTGGFSMAASSNDVRSRSTSIGSGRTGST